MNNLKKIYNLSPFTEYKNKTDFTEEIGSPVYGELTQKGVDMVVKHLQPYFNSKTIFYDLGSGLGKMVLHIGIQYGVKNAIGIEYSKERYQGSISLKENYAKNHKNISFFNTSIQNHNISDATIIYMDNTVYPGELCLEVYDKIKKGCLMVYNVPFGLNFPQFKDQIRVEKGTERTYPSKDFIYLIKK
jgi:SAM-dependent methyltransferase